MSSHASGQVSTSLLTVLALALVHRERPDWLAVGVGDAARAAGVSPERVSRLATRILGPWHDVVATVTRRGRSPKIRERDDVHRELVRLRALLAVASTVLGLVSLDKPSIRDAIVGAWRRLSTELPSLTKSAFCAALSLSERTLRHWLRASRARAAAAPPSSPPSPPRRPRTRTPRRPRFTFDVFLPGTQLGADTTDLSAFGVSLKLVGVQDIGGRAERLFDSVVIDTRESAGHVVAALRDVLRDCPGMHVITDQGTPYMAQETRAALDKFEAEHAPQKEGDPTGKSTVEKGFDSLKRIAEPLLALSGRLAELVPPLRSPDLAVPFARIVVATVLRAYQAGARAARRAVDARAGASEDTLLRAAARAREAARADDRSARLLLAHLHGLFLFSASCHAFVDRFRRYPLDVLRRAEAALRKRLLIDGAPDVRSVDRYFAALVRSAFAEHRARRAARSADRDLDADLRARENTIRDMRRAHREDPVRWLREALDLLVMQWLPRERALLFDGDGLGLAWTRGALDALLARFANGALDLVAGVLDDFHRARPDSLGDDGSAAILRLVERELALARQRHSSVVLADDNERAIPRAIGRSTRSADPDPLRN